MKDHEERIYAQVKKVLAHDWNMNWWSCKESEAAGDISTEITWWDKKEKPEHEYDKKDSKYELSIHPNAGLVKLKLMDPFGPTVFDYAGVDMRVCLELVGMCFEVYKTQWVDVD
ncbi:MAG: hypothetical protein DRI46_10955 [Chloroflexi bacterium]|nr:MAG: hypothetical protein DRI46_10955 [Chloroflexota bacterium]